MVLFGNYTIEAIQ